MALTYNLNSPKFILLLGIAAYLALVSHGIYDEEIILSFTYYKNEQFDENFS